MIAETVSEGIIGTPAGNPVMLALSSPATFYMVCLDC